MFKKQYFSVQEDESSRIPRSLQAVYLRANRGKEVTLAPKSKTANKTFYRNKIPEALCCMIGKKSKEKGSEKEPELEETEIRSSLSLSNADDTMNEHIDMVISPQVYLDDLLKSLGYSTRRHSTLKTGYHSKPTPLQIASYHHYLIKVTREGKKKDLLKEIMECGISPNPCNKHGESLVHMVCRTCEPETLQILLDAGTSVKVSDDYGRTPLHDACWRKEPNFDIIEKIVSQDLHLFFLKDHHGALPLSYIRREQWGQWVHFLKSKQNLWQKLASQQHVDAARLAEMPPHMFPIKNPPNSLPEELACMVAAGKISPDEAKILHMDAELSDESEESDSFSELDIAFLTDTSECAFTDEDFKRIMAVDQLGIGV